MEQILIDMAKTGGPSVTLLAVLGYIFLKYFKSASTENVFELRQLTQQMRDLTKATHENTIAITKLEVQQEMTNKELVIVEKLNNDLNKLWRVVKDKDY